MISEKFRLKLNESFSIRQGWLQKGINIVKENSNAFKGKDAPIVFGIGSNMCKSLKYYLKLFSLINDVKDGGVVLSEVGECIYKNDRFLEDPFSLFVLHLNSLLNRYINTVPYFYFNTPSLLSSTKEDINESINTSLSNLGLDVKQQMLQSDVLVFFRNYIDNESDDNPEDDAYSSPLSMLSLIKKEGVIYKKYSPKFDVLDSEIVFYNILLITNKDEITLDELLLMNNNPTLSLNLSESSLLYYLEELDKNGYIRLSKTAGLNTIKILKRCSIDELYSTHRGDNCV